MQSNTIIIGGGMAGLSCADRLLEAGQDFQLISESLGGRILYSPEARVNFGAYFLMGNYTQAGKLLRRGRRINPLKACFHKSERQHYGVLSSHTLKLLPQFIRLFAAMLEFSAHYEVFKGRCLVTPLIEALKADPYMQKIYSQPAEEFVREKRYEQAASDYVAMFAYGCTGADVASLTALDFLNVSMGLIVPIHQIILDHQAIKNRLANHLIADKIIGIEKDDQGYTLSGESGKIYQAVNIVLATPANVTQQLLGLNGIRGASAIYVYHVQGKLKAIYHKYEINLFPYTSEIMLTARQHDGTQLIYTRVKGSDLHAVCDDYKLLSEVNWEKAMYVHGTTLLEQCYTRGLYIAGDHNGLGLEPTAISGIYAAGQIINRSTHMNPS